MIRVKKWLDRKLNYVFTIPTILFVLGMVLFPIIYTFVLSFHSWRMSANIPWKFVGLAAAHGEDSCIGARCAESDRTESCL